MDGVARMFLKGERREAGKFFEIPDEVGLVGIAIFIRDVGQSGEFPVPQLAHRRLELSDL
jgi:hypothetical protein